MKTRYMPQTIIRASRVLELLAQAQRPLRLSEVSRELNITKSSLSGIMLAMEAIGWVNREQAKKAYKIGSGLLELCKKAFGPWDLVEIAKPFMEELVEISGESVFLGTLREDALIITSCLEGRGEMRVTSPPGTRLPLLAAATGKAILSAMDPKKAKEIIDRGALPRFTDRSITDPKRLWDEVQEARKRGYATDNEEYLSGVRAVAAPLLRGQELVGALWVVGFSQRLTTDALEGIGEQMTRITRTLSRLLEPVVTPR